MSKLHRDTNHWGIGKGRGLEWDFKSFENYMSKKVLYGVGDGLRVKSFKHGDWGPGDAWVDKWVLQRL